MAEGNINSGLHEFRGEVSTVLDLPAELLTFMPADNPWTPPVEEVWRTYIGSDIHVCCIANKLAQLFRSMWAFLDTGRCYRCAAVDREIEASRHVTLVATSFQLGQSIWIHPGIWWTWWVVA